MVQGKEDSILVEVDASGAKPLVVVGIPAFNEEKTIARVVLQAQKCAGKVVVCDDGLCRMLTEIAGCSVLKIRLGLYLLGCPLGLEYGGEV